jgi:hypothetical protein
MWKNIVGVDIDTSRKDSPVQISKPETFNENMTEQEWRQSIVDDMATLCEGICTLIHVAEQQGLKSSPDSLRDCIKHLQDGFADSSYKGITHKQKKDGN